MPPRPRTSPFDVVRAGLAAQGALVVAGLAAADPAAPTRCAGWTVRDLDRHLGQVVGSLTALLTPFRAAGAPASASDASAGPGGSASPGPEPAAAGVAGGSSSPVPAPGGDATAVVGLAGWAAALPAMAPSLDEAAHTEGPGLAAELPGLLAALPDADPAAVVQQRTGRHTVQDAATFRLVELVVHGRDLPEPVAPDRPALKVVVKALVGVLEERAPGRHVELRVPPYAAVQCVEGPRHTRGTPPNVAEVDPLAFLDLAAGRLTWSEAAADGRVRTWGDRADLSRHLPLLS